MVRHEADDHHSRVPVLRPASEILVEGASHVSGRHQHRKAFARDDRDRRNSRADVRPLGASTSGSDSRSWGVPLPTILTTARPCSNSPPRHKTGRWRACRFGVRPAARRAAATQRPGPRVASTRRHRRIPVSHSTIVRSPSRFPSLRSGRPLAGRAGTRHPDTRPVGGRPADSAEGRPPGGRPLQTPCHTPRSCGDARNPRVLRHDRAATPPGPRLYVAAGRWPAVQGPATPKQGRPLHGDPGLAMRSPDATAESPFLIRRSCDVASTSASLRSGRPLAGRAGTHHPDTRPVGGGPADSAEGRPPGGRPLHRDPCSSRQDRAAAAQTQIPGVAAGDDVGDQDRFASGM